MNKNNIVLIIILIIAILIIITIITLATNNSKEDISSTDEIINISKDLSQTEKDAKKEEEQPKKEIELKDTKTLEEKTDTSSPQVTQDDSSTIEETQGIIHKNKILKTDDENGKISTDDLKELLDQL